MKTMITVSFVSFIFFVSAFSISRTEPLIIDHTCLNIAEIPTIWIENIQKDVKWHYAHTSHGGQLTTGLQRIEDNDSTYSVAIGSSTLPAETGAFCVFDGQESHTYITPERYWERNDGMGQTRNVLNHNPNIAYSQWAWCTQLNGYSESEVTAYLDSMQVLEAEFPGVTFIYMTGNAQADGSEGLNRFRRNEQIRQFCRDNNKVLFDFADIDAWWFNPDTGLWEQNTTTYGTETFPIEHTQYNGDESGHTTYESCEQKGKAVWWMMAKLDGWDEGTSLIDGRTAPPEHFKLEQNYPNPFNPGTTIGYQLSSRSRVRLTVYNVLGQKVRTLVNEKQGPGRYSKVFNASDLPGGLYWYNLTVDNIQQVKKMILIK